MSDTEDTAETAEADSPPPPPPAPALSMATQKVARTTTAALTTSIKTVRVRVPKAVVERKAWQKFGKCAKLPPGPEKGVTFVSNDDIKLNLYPHKKGEDSDEESPQFAEKRRQQESKDPASANAKLMAVIDVLNKTTKGGYVPPAMRTGASEQLKKGDAIEESATVDASTKSAPQTAERYVPLHRRQQAVTSTQQPCEVRIGNLPEGIDYYEVKDHCNRFGSVVKLLLPRDQKTQLSRGFAYATYATHKEALHAIKCLDRQGFQNCILNADFSRPKIIT